MPITFISPDSSPREARVRRPNAVLLLDCPPEVRDRMERDFAAEDLKVVRADSAAAAIGELRQRDLPVLVSFSRGAAALKLITELRAHNTTTPLFAIVDADRADLVTEAVLAGVADVLTPDASAARVQAAIARELSLAGAAPPPGAAGPHDFYRHSTAMREASDAILRVPVTRAGVLVSGERGSGRRMAARALHAVAAASRPGQFVAIDCGASEPQQLELELFGIAARDEEDQLPARGLERITPGSKLSAALGGTLYLENVPEASTRVQRRLSRLLRDREVLVDGSSVVFDVRCVTGGGEELATAVRDGRLEDALYRRLTTVKVDLPPLRSRREDIAPLANRFLRDICASQQVPVKMFSRSALALFTALPWRSGNAGELRELLQLIVRRSSHRGIGVEDVLSLVRLDTGSVSLSHSGTLRQARTRFEHEYIASVLRQHRGRITQAAKTLGIQRTNLYRKMRTLKVAQPRVR